MSELKTLKDIYKEIESFDIDEKRKRERYLTLKILRNEAVKWVKKEGNCGMNINEVMEGDIIGWIKHFFNLTEEDLR